ncbi:MAG: hypothetical protein Kow0099_24720 [Candidatus Abyssubacteria bacterium]
MAYCQGCGNYVGDYSAYRHTVPGKGEIVLCFKCHRWADRHPGKTRFPAVQLSTPTERRVRTFSQIYMISAFGLFAFGGAFLISGRVMPAVLLFLASLSLFLLGIGMKKYGEK